MTFSLFALYLRINCGDFFFTLKFAMFSVYVHLQFFPVPTVTLLLGVFFVML